MKENYPTCKTCKYHIEGRCHCEKIHEMGYCTDNHNNDDCLIYDYNESGGFSSGDNFGCIHHQEK